MTLPADRSVFSDDAVALVTGSTSGIGREIARNVAECGAAVIVHGRDAERARETVADLPGDGHDWYVADFADLDAVREFAAAVRADYDRLDCLVSNAGTWQGDRRLVDVPGAAEGVELTFVVNHLAPFLLTHELTDRLAATAERRTAEPAPGATDGGVDVADGDSTAPTDPAASPSRIVTVSSAVHRRVTMDLDAVRGPDGPSGVTTYGLSKLANVMFTYELARRLPDGVTANCCQPGTSPTTRLARDGSLLSGIGWRLYGVIGTLLDSTASPARAARTPTYVACSPEVDGVSGEYFSNCEPIRTSDASYDRDAQRDLWEASEAWTGVD